MSRMVRRGEVTVNRVGPFRCAAILVAVLGGLLAALPALAAPRVDSYSPSEVDAGAMVDINGREFGATRTAQQRVKYGTNGSPTGEIALGDILNWTDTRIRVRLPGTMPAGVYWLAIYQLDTRRSNQLRGLTVRVPVVAIPAPITTPAPVYPVINGATPVRPGYMIGVFGRDFGERPGRVTLQIGAATYFLTDLDSHSRGIAGRLDRTIAGAPDGPASLIVERADGMRSNSWSVNFVATREVRLVPGGGGITMTQCSDEASDNDCGSTAYAGAPSFGGYHGSFHTFGESGTDEFSVTLANGWRFHDLEFSHGEIDMPVPTWNYRGGPTNPHIQVNWRNPEGWNVHHHYGFNLYIVGPVGVPHR